MITYHFFILTMFSFFFMFFVFVLVIGTHGFNMARVTSDVWARMEPGGEQGGRLVGTGRDSTGQGRTEAGRQGKCADGARQHGQCCNSARQGKSRAEVLVLFPSPLFSLWVVLPYSSSFW